MFKSIYTVTWVVIMDSLATKLNILDHCSRRRTVVLLVNHQSGLNQVCAAFRGLFFYHLAAVLKRATERSHFWKVHPHGITLIDMPNSSSTNN